jgi:hypothetical protein
MENGETGSVSCPIAGFDVSSEPSGSANTEINLSVSQLV